MMRRNAVVNRLCVWKPASRAMSARGRTDSLSSCFAFSMRRCSMKARGVVPVEVWKALAK